MQILGPPRIARSNQELIVYINRVPVVLIALMGLLFTIPGVVILTDRPFELIELLILFNGIVALSAALRLGSSANPLLVVSSRGISSPLINQTEPISWDRIVDVRIGVMYTIYSFDVHVRCGDDVTAGTRVALRVPAAGIPMRTKAFIAEALTYRPGDQTRNTD